MPDETRLRRNAGKNAGLGRAKTGKGVEYDVSSGNKWQTPSSGSVFTSTDSPFH